MKPELVVLAAGMGSRYGGLKQIDPMGPQGETLLDYSVFDALRAGFGKVIFVIRRDFADQFQSTVGQRFASFIPVDYAYQSLDDLPDCYPVPATRTKPWGTGQAVLAAREQVSSNFCVINADDFYGREAYQQMGSLLMQSSPLPGSLLQGWMVGYRLRDTLSPHGTVSRGLCRTDVGNHLVSVREMTRIAATPTGIIHQEPDQEPTPLTGQELVSVNFWGLTPAFFGPLADQFRGFLNSHLQDSTAEFYLPKAIDEMIATGQATIRVECTASPWFGVTYREDKARVQSSLQRLIGDGIYPERLFS